MVQFYSPVNLTVKCTPKLIIPDKRWENNSAKTFLKFCVYKFNVSGTCSMESDIKTKFMVSFNTINFCFYFYAIFSDIANIFCSCQANKTIQKDLFG